MLQRPRYWQRSRSGGGNAAARASPARFGWTDPYRQRLGMLNL